MIVAVGLIDKALVGLQDEGVYVGGMLVGNFDVTAVGMNVRLSDG